MTRSLYAMMMSPFVGLTATLLSYLYAVTPFTLDAGGTQRGWPLWWVNYWWSSWSTPPSYGTSFNAPSFILDFLFWLAIFLAPQALYYTSKKLNRPLRATNQQSLEP